MRGVLIVSMLMLTGAQAADWNGRWVPHNAAAAKVCADETGTEGELLEFKAKEILGNEWNAEIKGVASTKGVYTLDLFTPASEMTGAAEKSKWLAVVAKGGKNLMLSTKAGKDWELYDKCP